MNGVPSIRDAVETPRKRVFVVGEHPIIRQGLVQTIGREPDLVVCGDLDRLAGAAEAIIQATPQLLLLETSFHSMDGLEQIKQFRSGNPDLPLLVLSTATESFLAERILRAGAQGYVLMRETAEDLLSAIRRCLRGDIYLSQALADELLNRITGTHSIPTSIDVAILSDRELEVFHMLGKGLGVREIAEKLYRSVKTIEAHREHIKRKLNLKSSAALLRYAFHVTKEV